MKLRGFFRQFFSILPIAALLTVALLFSSCDGDAAPPQEPVTPVPLAEEQGDASSALDNDDVPLSPLPHNGDTDSVHNTSPIGDESLTGDFTIYYLDVGQAESAIVSCDGAHMLIDGGNREDSQKLYSFLKSYGITHLDYVIGTHGHEDHIGGIPGALRFATAGKAYCSVDNYGTKAFDNFLKAVKGQGLALTKPSPGETFSLGGAEVEILAPINFRNTDHNQLSIVLKITYGETSFLFTADAGRDAEQDILAAGYDIDCDVLQVGHHGSESSTTYPFLREVMPGYAVISVGKNNDYGHPTDAVLSRLRDADVTVYRTDLNGMIVCTSDGKTVSLEPDKGSAFVYTGPGSAGNQGTGSAGAGSGDSAGSGSSSAGASSGTNTEPSPGAAKYLANSNSMKFHNISCGTGQKTAEHNRVYFSDRAEVIKGGYVPAKCCNP